jgi:branched-chain amino acid aminotransferase
MTPSPSTPQATGQFGFGAALADQALLAEHVAGSGWQPPRLLTRSDCAIPIASAAVQYGLSCFEGLKAFRRPDGAVHLFRADRHAARMVASAERVCLPPLPPGTFLRDVAAVVRAVDDLVPDHGTGALYIRPTIAATEEFLGIRTAKRHSFTIVATPSPRPSTRALGLAVERVMVRAAPGGIGEAKVGGNYAASLLAAERARASGLDQVLWLDAHEHRYLAEAGVMNIFVAIDGRVRTPPLDGTILPGVTRDSCLTLLREMGIAVAEEAIALDEVVDAHARGRQVELFGTGTAACVVPIERLALGTGELRPSGGDVAGRLRDALMAIQEGRAADRYGWCQRVERPAARGGARGALSEA